MEKSFYFNMEQEKLLYTALEGYKEYEQVKKVLIPKFEIMYNANGFGVYQCEDEEERLFNMKGSFVSPLEIGQSYEAQGVILVYRGEKQLSMKEIRQIRPVNKKGIISYLQTLKGLKSKAESIYDVFGDKSIDVLMDTPAEVSKKIRGIGKKSVEGWSEQLVKMKDSQATFTALLGFGLTINQSKKLFDRYEDSIVEKVQENPYFLATEVKGYGFERCDKIGRSIGTSPESEFRIREGLMHVLEQGTKQGHTFLPFDEFLIKSKMMLSIQLTAIEMKELIDSEKGQIGTYKVGDYSYPIDMDLLRKCYSSYQNEWNQSKKETYRYVAVSIKEDAIYEAIEHLASNYRVIYKEGKVYLRRLYEFERNVAKLVKEISIQTPFINSDGFEEELDNFLKEEKIILEVKQREAVIAFAENKGGFHILNGSAGCGKTFVLNIILRMLEWKYQKNKLKLKVLVMAPTGKASKVASRAINRECLTIHRGLDYTPFEGFTFNEDNPLPADIIIVDESSMLDIELAYYLLSAIKHGAKVIFMGDTKQLPSVGPGNCLKDLIESGHVTVVTLDVVKRQGALSGIILNANKIISGEMISTVTDTNDAFVLARNTPASIREGVLASIDRILTFPGYTLEDIQVLVPQRAGQLGTYYFNYLIQAHLNPDKGTPKVLNRKFDVNIPEEGGMKNLSLFFREGDKVIHIKNNYEMNWYVKGDYADYVKVEMLGITNGECGVIEKIEQLKGEDNETFTRIIVKYEDKYVFYEKAFDELDHSYALTIHKSQGSQWKAVIMPMAKQYYNMLDNNLFYTGYTRAELFSVVIGQLDAIAFAIRTYKSDIRHSALVEWINEDAEAVA